MSKQPIQHLDIIGQNIEVNQLVVYSSGNHLHLGRVDKLTAKQVLVSLFEIDGRRPPRLYNKTAYKYPTQVLVANQEFALTKLLSQSQ